MYIYIYVIPTIIMMKLNKICRGSSLVPPKVLRLQGLDAALGIVVASIVLYHSMTDYTMW